MQHHVLLQLGDPGQWPVEQEENRLAAAQDDPTRKPEVAVEPRVHEGTAVDLDRQLPPAGAARVRLRLESQVGRVRVRADDAQRSVGRQSRRCPPRDQGSAVNDVGRAGRLVPRLRLVQPAEPRLVEPGRSVGDGVVRRGRRLEVVEQVGDSGHPGSQAGQVGMLIGDVFRTPGDGEVDQGASRHGRVHEDRGHVAGLRARRSGRRRSPPGSMSSSNLSHG